MTTITRLAPAMLVALTTLPLGAVPALAATYTCDHNGSAMRVEVEGRDVRVVYDAPRSGLARIGVRPGTVLFDGRVENGYLEGLSRIFSRACGEQDYFVYGDFLLGRDFTLTGAAPVLDEASCRVVDNVNEGSNANLRFTASAAPRPDPVRPRPTPPRAASGCLTGVSTSLNMRVGPGGDYGRVAEIPAGTCGIQAMARCDGEWCLVRSGNDIGWVSMRYIQR